MAQVVEMTATHAPTRQREKKAQPAEEKDAKQLSVEPARPIRGENRQWN